MRLSDFDYALPEELIAQEPVTPRDASRLLALSRAGGALRDLAFTQLADLLNPGDLLVMNDTRVIPARLVGRKETGGRCELVLVEPATAGVADGRWLALGGASKPFRPGARLHFGALAGEVEANLGDGMVVVAFDRSGPALERAVEEVGTLPLPPYIHHAPGAADRERYQTVLARKPGSAAAPTAGLHFTESLLARLAGVGVERTTITLHVGPGTFLPVRGDDVASHRMHEERFEVSEEAARAFAACRARGGRVVAVGTTSVRTLESAFEEGALRAGPGRTALFVHPGYVFRAVDALLTNFHLPRSTLLMLVCAFGGTEHVLRAYHHAVASRYRFFSYGDAMFLA